MTLTLSKSTVMYMNVTEFRRNISSELDKALQGQPVTIERGGVIFTVTASVQVAK